jgi:D-alanine-D-alanine ligase-like ATP-grasp enzyme
VAILKIGLLNKKRGNFALQERFIGAANVADQTDAETEHRERALIEAGYRVHPIRWGPDFINDLQTSQVDLVFNVSSLVQAAILEELEIPYVGSDAFTIAVATDKSLAETLRATGFGVTEMAGYETKGEVDIFEVVMRRAGLPKVLQIIDQTEAKAFITVEETRRMHRGWRLVK